MTEKSKIIICGAGIGGLTAAHELSKKNFDVVVYERNAIVGGLARSDYYTKDNNKYPVEYSWRVYGSGYKNLLRLLSEIPLSNKNGLNKTVFNNLVKVYSYIFPRFGKGALILPHQKKETMPANNFSTKDKIAILNKIFYCITMSTERMNSFDNINWKDFCSDLSDEVKKYMVQMWGPVLGMDATYMSFPVIARMVGILIGGLTGSASFLYLMNKPTNDGWFNEWTEYLQNTNGVKIKTNFEILDFKVEDGKIKSVVVKDNEKNIIFEDTADYFVCGMPVEAIAKIVAKNNELLKIPELKNTIPLAEKCNQIQLSVQIFLDKELVYPIKEQLVLYLPDTPWSLIIEPEERAWGSTFCTDKNVKTVLSVGICQVDAPGIIYGKPFVNCTKEEVEKEVWEQIVKSYKMSGIKTEDGETIDKASILLFYIWESFKFEKNKEVSVWEPKFSNNAGSLQFQPAHATQIENFLFATAYTKTDRYIYSMESAAEAGTLCANEIFKKSSTQSPATKIFPYKGYPIFFWPLVVVDKILFKFGLPHLSKLFFGNSFFLACIYLVFVVTVALEIISFVF